MEQWLLNDQVLAVESVDILGWLWKRIVLDVVKTVPRAHARLVMKILNSFGKALVCVLRKHFVFKHIEKMARMSRVNKT